MRRPIYCGLAHWQLPVAMAGSVFQLEQLARSRLKKGVGDGGTAREARLLSVTPPTKKKKNWWAGRDGGEQE